MRCRGASNAYPMSTRSFFLVLLVLGGGFLLHGWLKKNPEALPDFVPAGLVGLETERVSEAKAYSEADYPYETIPTGQQPPPFASRIRVPAGVDGEPVGEIPPGYFYVVERASVQTRNGVIAIVPGDSVKLLHRHKDGRLKVTNDMADFLVKESQVTRSVEVAREAEQKDWARRYRTARR
jgi:hypothetical protein